MVAEEAEEDKGVLGEKVDAPDTYSPDVLFPVERARGRKLLGIAGDLLPFEGEDVWNCYELSWLNGHGVPRRATLELRVPCTTPCIVESKSLKLYLNSLSFHRFSSPAVLLDTIATDVGRTVGGAIGLLLLDSEPPLLDSSAWVCIDEEDVGELPAEVLDAPDATHLTIDKSYAATSTPVHERLVSHLLRTLCPVTGQPDWGSVLIEYTGSAPLDRAGLLKYLCSLRREIGFHENAVERIFLAIEERCKPLEALRVTGRFFRRGGIDINPTRATRGAAASLGSYAAQLRIPGQ